MIDVGFIGLGIMGRPMAGHLQAVGHRLFLHDVGPVAQDLVAAGGLVRKSGKEVAEESDVVIIMVPDTPHVEAVLFGANGVAEGISKGKIVVDMSSISPLATKEFAKKINQRGADYLDAPVSGGEVGAKAASLTIMVGGPEKAFSTVKPLFEKMGKNITLVGGNGDGQTTKVANQIIVALTIAAVGEALLFASKAGADPALVRQALMGGLASNRLAVIRNNYAFHHPEIDEIDAAFEKAATGEETEEADWAIYFNKALLNTFFFVSDFVLVHGMANALAESDVNEAHRQLLGEMAPIASDLSEFTFGFAAAIFKRHVGQALTMALVAQVNDAPDIDAIRYPFLVETPGLRNG